MRVNFDGQQLHDLVSVRMECFESWVHGWPLSFGSWWDWYLWWGNHEYW